MPRGRFTRRSSGRPLRGMDWGGQRGQAGGVPDNGIAASWILTPADAMSGYVDPTIMAIRGLISLRLTANALGGWAGAGVINWSGVQGATAVPTQLPDPILSPNLDWMWRGVYPVPGGAPQNSNYDTVIENIYYSKARRRLGNTEGLLLVVSNDTGVTVEFAWDFRYLLKE